MQQPSKDTGAMCNRWLPLSYTSVLLIVWSRWSLNVKGSHS